MLRISLLSQTPNPHTEPHSPFHPTNHETNNNSEPKTDSSSEPLDENAEVPIHRHSIKYHPNGKITDPLAMLIEV